jgi:hypothetical protein
MLLDESNGGLYGGEDGGREGGNDGGIDGGINTVSDIESSWLMVNCALFKPRILQLSCNTVEIFRTSCLFRKKILSIFTLVS